MLEPLPRDGGSSCPAGHHPVLSGDGAEGCSEDEAHDHVDGLEDISFGESAVADEGAGDAGEGRGFALVAAVE
ncbi:hypothetical protein ACIO6T_45240, partial [Streptomyces sp. NPDC087532]|uniref:hypothetical protein n=1 Tax=Streptomyces sp. NPDC087532 TaxID=3365795 RepID=UPI0037FEDE7A